MAEHIEVHEVGLRDNVARAATEDVAAPMRMMFRIKDYDPQRGFTR